MTIVCSFRFYEQYSSIFIINLNKNHLCLKVSSGIYTLQNKSSDTDNKFDKTAGDGGERILVSICSIKIGEETLFVSECRSDKEAKGVSTESDKSRGGVSNHILSYNSILRSLVSECVTRK